eukprot:CAMPEP_0182418200 /NCGR_PEP_ID=MMETSP1167-20130531/2677_1 /TAXON_ID=2988 /ORGANISM="Mallomonas Sp, Strain CCMP3275" /LENGTH=503 /DNA_ID=CAMNT_0024592287 /DNA_START=291 /DNA_END=1802 /DNA_ORIENTATION=+
MVGGKWVTAPKVTKFPDPMNGEPFLEIPDLTKEDLAPYVASLTSCPKSGLHNPFKSPERYNMLGAVCAKAGAMLRKPEVADFFARLIQRVAPKSYPQALGEVVVTQRFIENFSGDQVRFLARSFGVPGDHAGQISHGYRWPYGPCVLITPFNFPIEIAVLQLFGGLFMGNKMLLKSDSRVSIVMEQALRMFHECGLPPEDVDFINCDGPVMHDLLLRAQPKMTLFTGSQRVAELLAKDLHGRIKVEDAGFDWKILGPDVGDMDFVSQQCDTDAYGSLGQKCSAQSILFMHENWSKAGLVDKLRDLVEKRSMKDLTHGPILTVTNDTFFSHLEAILEIRGTSVLFGGKPLTAKEPHNIPSCYGSFLPTAVQVPIEAMMKPENFSLCTTEIFGPFQIIVEYNDSQLPLVLEACERMHSHLTAAVVSNDVHFQNKVLANTINGTTYCGRRARTTGAPQNHWFGPAGDPRAGGIGTPEAIKMVWSCHREIIVDEGDIPADWTVPPRT